eukprot:TRINITY_DN16192_c0_g1_i1.p1 TRINITY_DN16192_c0_g1~~TRINITY_DN16192_c0_g1_i1.p1  ORF type:complete len:120 (-),score=14.27 TRINITY_DN16192_c0_g1_i1:176-535(-)
MSTYNKARERLGEMMMNFGRSSTQQMCLLSWSEGWDSQQKSRFYQALSEEMATSSEAEDLLFGLENMDLSGDSHQVFNCQLRLFRSWFKAWAPNERESFVTSMTNRDPNLLIFLKERRL